MQPSDVVSILSSSSGDSKVVVSIPTINSKPITIRLDCPDIPFKDQLGFISMLIQANGKMKVFANTASLSVSTPDQGNISMPVSLAIKELSLKAENTSELARGFGRLPPGAKSFYIKGGWSSVAEVYGLEGLRMAMNSNIMSKIIARSVQLPGAPKFSVVPGAESIGVVAGNQRLVVVGDALGNEPFRLIVDAARSESMARQTVSITEILERGGSVDEALASDRESKGYALIAAALAASEIIAHDRSIASKISSAYSDLPQHVIARVVHESRSWGGDDQSKIQNLAYELGSPAENDMESSLAPGFS